MTETEQREDGESRPRQYGIPPLWAYGSSIHKLTDTRDLLSQLTMKLRSAVEYDGKIIQIDQSLINEKGINQVMYSVESLANQKAIFSNLDDNEVRNVMNLFSDTLIRLLMIKRKEFEVRNFADAETITMSSIMTCYTIVKRAYGEGDKKFWKGSVQEIKTSTSVEQGKGFSLANLNPFKR